MTKAGVFRCRRCGREYLYYGERPKYLKNLCIPCYETEKGKRRKI
jgi:formylmethanofuran dehydrogenase subunit E